MSNGKVIATADGITGTKVPGSASASFSMALPKSTLLLVAGLLFFWLSTFQAAAQSNSTSPLGTNLDQVTYYSAEQPFLNIFKTGGGWTTGTATTADTGEEALLYNSFLDANGYPTTLTGGPAHAFTQLQVLVLRQLGSPWEYPSGRYVLLYDGAGTLNYKFDAVKNASLSSPGRDLLDVTASEGGIYITLTSTVSTNYLRNIRLVYAPTATNTVIDPNETLVNSGEMFNPIFISKTSSYKTLRFKDWDAIDYNWIVNWSDRLTPARVFWNDNPLAAKSGGDPRGGGGGVPAEVMIALCNELNADGWFNMPSLASDDYVTQFATLAHATLKSTLKAYVEYSNEVWNNGAFATGLFEQMAVLGQALFPNAYTQPPSQAPFPYAFDYGIYSAVHMGGIWKHVWGADANRVIRVAAGQNGYAGRNQTILNFVATQDGGSASYFSGTSGANLDALATAPYFGYAVPDTFTLDQLFTEITAGGLVSGGYPGGMIKQVVDWAASDYSVAAAAGLPLVAYEGGQSLVDWTHSDVALQNLYAAANQDARMGVANTTLFNGWKNVGGTLFVNFTDVIGDSVWGYWGTLNNIWEATSSKYGAVMSFISSTPCWWKGCGTGTVLGPVLKVAPNGSATSGGTPTFVQAATPNGATTTVATMSPNTTTAVGAATATGTSNNSGNTPSGISNNSGTIIPSGAPASPGSATVAALSPLVVEIHSPANGSRLRDNGNVNISVSAKNVSGIASIVIKGDNQILQTCIDTASCSGKWQHIDQGTHTISAIALDKGGKQGKASITILSVN